MTNTRSVFIRRACAALLGLATLSAPLAARATPSLLIEVESGKVLIENDATKPWYPASVTKLMTAYVTFKAIRAGRLTGETLITVSPNAAAQAPSKMGFKPGTQITVDNALKMMIVKSANDMAVVLAEGVAGSVPAFADEMNAAAAALGMNGTHYNNPNGLPDPGQITTARDLAVLGRALIREFPEHEELFRTPAIQLGKRVIRNYNKLIDRYPGADGMKTGFICASGFNLVASAHRGNKRILAVVLGTPSGKARTEQAALLLEKGFQQSWSIFGQVSPTVDSLRNEGGEPTDMRAYVCGAKRKQVASEAEEDDGDGGAPAARGFAAAGMGGMDPRVTGASLLQTLPPSMPPVLVWVGPTPNQAALDAAYPPAPAKPAKPAVKPKPSKKDAAKPAQPGIMAPEEDGAVASAAPPAAAKPAAPKPAAKPAAVKPDAATAKPAPKPKPAAAPKPAAKPAASTAPAQPAAPPPAPAPRPAG
ncbi:D-alanyl-D-alanine carboxypeptidase family protein [Ancylobacter terrae]|uniref:D-alanyl-D-alanine carboxypeptidase family protein n=1 Tax=Ancylobacter sp. sgz301288 TaxID=3342077 RepID=UPI003859BCFB